VYALTLFLRSQIPFTRLPSVLGRVFAGHSIGSDARLLALLAWSNLKILAGSPQGRPTMDEALDRARRMWQLLGFEPDVAGFRRLAVEALSIEPQRMTGGLQAPGPARVVIRKGGEWLETPNGARHALGRRGPLRRVLLARERPLPEAGNNRVWVTISTLRKLGLGDVLQRWDGGYRLDPSVPCHIEAA
jgi:hypothetical protein